MTWLVERLAERRRYLDHLRALLYESRAHGRSRMTCRSESERAALG